MGCGDIVGGDDWVLVILFDCDWVVVILCGGDWVVVILLVVVIGLWLLLLLLFLLKKNWVQNIL